MNINISVASQAIHPTQWIAGRACARERQRERERERERARE